MFQNNQYPMWQIPYNPQMNGYSQPNYLQTQNVFETRKVSNEEEAKQYVNTVTAQPLLLFENDREIFYMVQNGTLQKFGYSRIDEQSQLASLGQQVKQLTESVNLILGYIDQGGLSDGKSIQPNAESKTK